ncbi:MAG: hypothetical protein PHR56_01620 [Dehalococcoidales bacterium]|nr:hypothetical protein [Dehalococcoidales bacterium]
MSVTCEICGEEFTNSQGLAGHNRLKHSEMSPAKSEGSRSVASRAQPLDIVIENLRLPVVPEQYNGSHNIYVAGFNDGVMHGARSILAGIRAAQELSTMGIQQAVPLIKMAQEMRHAEGQAAQVLAQEMGQAINQGNQQTIAAIHSLAAAQSPPSAPGGPDPMAGMMADMMKPVFGQLIQQVLKLSGMGPGVSPVNIPAGGSSPGGGTQPVTEQKTGASPGISEHRREEWEE